MMPEYSNTNEIWIILIVEHKKRADVALQRG